MTTETDLFGNAIPVTVPAPPIYDRRGIDPIPAAEVAARACTPDVPDRPHAIIKDGKYSAWLLHTDL